LGIDEGRRHCIDYLEKQDKWDEDQTYEGLTDLFKSTVDVQVVRED
jgi:hypothetical protein